MNHRRNRSGISLTDVVVVLAMVAVLLTLTLPAMQGSREDERRQSCLVRMKNLSLSMHLYHDNYQQLPASAFYNDGKNLGDKDIALKTVVPGQGGKEATSAPYGFIVKVLPYVEQGHLFDQIDFKNRAAFDKGNEPLAAKVLPVFNCPSFQGEQHSKAKDYDKFAAGGPKPALMQYKALGATTLKVLQDAKLATEPTGDGGVLIPYKTYSIATLKAPTMTAVFCETRESNYAAWWDGTTDSIPGFDPTIDKDTSATKPALWTTEQNHAFMPVGTFGGTEAMQWGPSSEHPGVVNHAFGGTETRSIKTDIDPKIYAAVITRRPDDNGDIGEYFKD